MSGELDPDLAFCQHLPKVELHAHLTGSITRPILQAIWDSRAASEDGFRDTVQSPGVVLADETVGQSITTFFGLFNTYLYRLVSTRNSLIMATHSVLALFADDGVVHLELRTTPRAFSDCSAEEEIRAVLDVMMESNHSRTMQTVLILSVDRSKHSGRQAMEIVQLAIRLRDEGKPIVGIDLSGDPHKPIDLAFLRPAFRLAKESNLGLALHFAEIPESSTTEELGELLSWQPDRLGHVIHVSQPLQDEIVQMGISVELCLTCNVLAEMLPFHDIGDTPTFTDHHFKSWWNHPSGKAKINLGTDDVGVFGSLSSEEHYLVAKHFGLSRKDMIKLSKIAMDGAFCGMERKEIVWNTLHDFEDVAVR